MINVGVLGAGNFARKHLQALDALKDRARPAAVARRTAVPFEEAEALGIPRRTPEALLASADVDAIAVCIPNGLHRHWVEAALRAGKHVLCEKPLALSVDDVDTLAETAESCGRILMTGHLTRHTAAYAAVADLLAERRLGAVMAVHGSRLQVRTTQPWRMHPNLGGGALFDLLIHDFDLLGWFLGRPVRVGATGHRHAEGACDYAAAVFAYAGGAVATVEGGFVLPEGDCFNARLRVHCAGGKVEVDGGNVRVVEDGGRWQRVSLAGYANTHKGLVSEYEEFFDAIEGVRPTRLHPMDARSAVEYAALAEASTRSGEMLKFR